jgi:uncharacterized membrane protein YbhN (UPF0104 family)
VSAPPGRRWGGFALRLLASAAVLAVVVHLVGVDRALEGLRRLRPLPWALALLAFGALHVLSAMKWRAYVVFAGAPLRRGAALRCHAAGLFANLCLPSLIGGDVLRAGLALRKTSPRSALLVASAIDRISDATPLRALPFMSAVVAGGGIAGLLSLRWMVRSRLVRRLPRKAARAVLGVARALRTMARRPLRAAAIWLASVGIQALFVVVNVHLGRSMGFEMTWGQWFLLWPLAKIAAMAPVSFGGLGVREAAFAALVAPFASEQLAVAESIAWQSVLVAGGLLAGAWWMLSSRAAGESATTAGLAEGR